MGLPKTATSSFQKTCFNNYDLLKQRGFIYPIFRYIDNPSKRFSNHNIPILNCFKDKPWNIISNLTAKVVPTPEVKDAFLSQFESSMDGTHNVIISAEGLSGLSKNAMQNLLSTINRYNYEVVPILGVRSPYAYNCSIKQQNVKTGIYKGSLAHFQSQLDKINKLRSIFGSTIKFLPFKTMCKHDHGPVGYLLETMGVPLEGIQFATTNEGVSNEYVRAQLAFNRAEPLTIDGELNPNYRRVGQDCGTHKFYLTREEYEGEVERQCNEENEYFKNNLGEEFCDTEIKFAKMPTFEQVLDACPNILCIVLNNDYIGTLRDVAVKIEDTSLKDAYRLMNLAHIARPHGPFIKKKLDIYQEKLEKIN